MTKHRLQDQLRIIREHQTAAPVSVVSIAHALGIDVYGTKSWADNVSGKIQLGPDGAFDIYVNLNHPQVRQRFTIAHEIAHAVLHPDLIGDGISDDAQWRSGLPDPVEYQANKMAADILMPQHLIEECLTKGHRDPGYLAAKFGVSKRSMEIRLEGFQVPA